MTARNARSTTSARCDGRRTATLYEYYSLTGAKMWITNGSIATQFCLYARTPEGVTGFLVDRHAEGLKVGADEKKTGQRGSPTNEISLDSVRVPREAVIGYEGHGQVNALETLNVGRCGLAVVSGALMRKLMREANELIPASPERDRLLGEAAAILFSSESLAYYLVGLFDRPHESVRMESAIAKYVCSEDIHELITLLEQAFGPEGQTEQFLLEKARRDSRILTIYEGTNEVQRFLILKDLIAQAAELARGCRSSGRGGGQDACGLEEQAPGPGQGSARICWATRAGRTQCSSPRSSRFPRWPEKSCRLECICVPDGMAWREGSGLLGRTKRRVPGTDAGRRQAGDGEKRLSRLEHLPSRA